MISSSKRWLPVAMTTQMRLYCRSRIGFVLKLVDENGSGAKRSVRVAPDVYLRIPLHAGDEACK